MVAKKPEKKAPNKLEKKKSSASKPKAQKTSGKKEKSVKGADSGRKDAAEKPVDLTPWAPSMPWKCFLIFALRIEIVWDALGIAWFGANIVWDILLFDFRFHIYYVSVLLLRLLGVFLSLAGMTFAIFSLRALKDLSHAVNVLFIAKYPESQRIEGSTRGYNQKEADAKRQEDPIKELSKPEVSVEEKQTDDDPGQVKENNDDSSKGLDQKEADRERQEDSIKELSKPDVSSEGKQRDDDPGQVKENNADSTKGKDTSIIQPTTEESAQRDLHRALKQLNSLGLVTLLSVCYSVVAILVTTMIILMMLAFLFATPYVEEDKVFEFWLETGIGLGYLGTQLLVIRGFVYYAAFSFKKRNFMLAPMLEPRPPRKHKATKVKPVKKVDKGGAKGKPGKESKAPPGKSPAIGKTKQGKSEKTLPRTKP